MSVYELSSRNSFVLTGEMLEGEIMPNQNVAIATDYGKIMVKEVETDTKEGHHYISLILAYSTDSERMKLITLFPKGKDLELVIV